jgi:hypothetical protein
LLLLFSAFGSQSSFEKKQPLNRALARLKRPSFSEGIGLFFMKNRFSFFLFFFFSFFRGVESLAV